MNSCLFTSSVSSCIFPCIRSIFPSQNTGLQGSSSEKKLLIQVLEQRRTNHSREQQITGKGLQYRNRPGNPAQKPRMALQSDCASSSTNKKTRPFHCAQPGCNYKGRTEKDWLTHAKSKRICEFGIYEGRARSCDVCEPGKARTSTVHNTSSPFDFGSGIAGSQTTAWCQCLAIPFPPSPVRHRRLPCETRRCCFSTGQRYHGLRSTSNGLNVRYLNLIQTPVH